MRSWCFRLLILWGDSNVRHSEKTFYACPFTEVVTFHVVPDPLQHIAEDEGAHDPLPVITRPHQEQKHARHGQGNADKVDREIERMLMAQAPIVDCAAERFAFEQAHARVEPSPRTALRGMRTQPPQSAVRG